MKTRTSHRIVRYVTEYPDSSINEITTGLCMYRSLVERAVYRLVRKGVLIQEYDERAVSLGKDKGVRLSKIKIFRANPTMLGG